MQKLKDPEVLSKLLNSKNSDVGEKYKAIFELKALANEHAQSLLIEGFNYLDESELLKHEIAYALGQMKFNPMIKDFLRKVLENKDEKPVVRHEAGEALANSEDLEMIKILEKYTNDASEEVRVTCQLGVSKLETYETLKSRYACKYSQTREPAAPFNEEEMKKELKCELEQNKEEEFYQKCLNYVCSEEISIFNKYRTIYFLRNINNSLALKTLCQIFDKKYRDKTRILLRHEICFIFGQLESAETLPSLEAIISDPTENEIVRHEAISAYSSISKDKALLEKYSKDESRIVAESCLVALNLIEYWQNPEI